MAEVLVTQLDTDADAPAVRRLVGSLRRFGGAQHDIEAWIFTDPLLAAGAIGAHDRVRPVPFSPPGAVRACPFGFKVAALAEAEAMAGEDGPTLLWLDPECIVVRPLDPYLLDVRYDVALRPVHARNVGLPPGVPLDAFWAGVCAAAGIADIEGTVESFVDGEPLRAYYNTHGMAIAPGLGLCRRWLEALRALVADRAFQHQACADAAHRVFLFQAVFAALIAAMVPGDRIRPLPPTCNYPYNLHARVPAEKRPRFLDELTTVVCEGRSLDPGTIADVDVGAALRGWLAAQAPPPGHGEGGPTPPRSG